jgi:hypothetical protein
MDLRAALILVPSSIVLAGVGQAKAFPVRQERPWCVSVANPTCSRTHAAQGRIIISKTESLDIRLPTNKLRGEGSHLSPHRQPTTDNRLLQVGIFKCVLVGVT